MVSPRPSCISWPVSTMVSPPSWRIATSKETRVRVEGLSKIIASILPARPPPHPSRPDALREEVGGARRSFFMARLTSMMTRNASGAMSIKSRKWRGEAVTASHHGGLLVVRGSFDPLCRAVDPGGGLGDLALLDDQRRQQAHHIVARRDREQVLGAQRIDEFAVRTRRDEAEQQALAAHLRDDARMAVHDLGETLAEQDGALAHAFEKSRRQHDVEHRIADRHGERVRPERRAMGAG